MEFEKDFIPRPYEVKAKEHVNKVCHEDEICFGFHYNECEQSHRYCGFTNGYTQAITDAISFLKSKGMSDIAIRMQEALLYGITNK